MAFRVRGSAQLVPRRWTSATARVRVLPDFIIIGAQRCGTTSLYQYLMNHPSLALNQKKEIHFFDYNYHRGISWYRSHFPPVTQRLLRNSRGRPLVTGEASPYYIFHPHAPHRIARLIPRVKLIVLLRNPIDRAYSHYQHEVRLGHETLDFAEALRREEDRLAGEVDKILNDDSYYSFNHQHYSYLARGIYVDQLRRWFQVFPRHQFLILRSEDFYADPAQVLSRVESFLGVEALTPPNLDVHNRGRYSPMDSNIRRELMEYFRPHNDRLSDLLGMDMGWND